MDSYRLADDFRRRAVARAQGTPSEPCGHDGRADHASFGRPRERRNLEGGAVMRAPCEPTAEDAATRIAPQPTPAGAPRAGAHREPAKNVSRAACRQQTRSVPRASRGSRSGSRAPSASIARPPPPPPPARGRPQHEDAEQAGGARACRSIGEKSAPRWSAHAAGVSRPANTPATVCMHADASVREPDRGPRDQYSRVGAHAQRAARAPRAPPPPEDGEPGKWWYRRRRSAEAPRSRRSRAPAGNLSPAARAFRNATPDRKTRCRSPSARPSTRSRDRRRAASRRSRPDDITTIAPKKAALPARATRARRSELVLDLHAERKKKITISPSFNQ